MADPDSSDRMIRAIVLILAIVVLAPVLMMLFAVPMWGMTGMGGGSGWMMGGTVSPVWSIGMSLIWLIVLVAIGYVLYRGFVAPTDAVASTDPALEELRLAYARGDLTDEEFEERRETLLREG